MVLSMQPVCTFVYSLSLRWGKIPARSTAQMCELHIDAAQLQETAICVQFISLHFGPRNSWRTFGSNTHQNVVSGRWQATLCRCS